jgi:hypothetical protein
MRKKSWYQKGNAVSFQNHINAYEHRKPLLDRRRHLPLLGRFLPLYSFRICQIRSLRLATLILLLTAYALGAGCLREAGLMSYHSSIRAARHCSDAKVCGLRYDWFHMQLVVTKISFRIVKNLTGDLNISERRVHIAGHDGRIIDEVQEPTGMLG